VDAVYAVGQYLQRTLHAGFSWERAGGVQLALPAELQPFYCAKQHGWA
jgi:hypothetical protein